MKSELASGSSLVDVQAAVSARSLALRSIDRTIHQEDFAKAYEGADEESRAALFNLIEQADRYGVERWLRQRLHCDYGAMSLRELRLIGQRLGVPRYQHLPKASLLSEIVRYEQAAASRTRIDRTGTPDPQRQDNPRQAPSYVSASRIDGSSVRCPVEVA